jgi:cytidine deaminase
MIRVKFDELSADDQALVLAAERARENAYTPYSNHKVGSSVRASSGQIYAAPNVEIVTLQQSVHAERNAVNMAVANGERRIEAVVCYGPYSGIPCAECRQVIWEFCGANPDTLIIGVTLDHEVDLMTIGEIYPHPYGPETKGIDPRTY